MPITYKRLRLIPSNSAMREMHKLGLTLQDCKQILEEGEDAPRKRKKDIIEKWLGKGKKIYNAVVAKNYDEIAKKEVWVIIHIGKFSKK